MREIALDTETTGLDPLKGDRVIEIGCVELFNHLPTGRTYHAYINPQRDVPEIATSISGITTEFLYDKPLFKDVYQDFLQFVENTPLVIHNASFDMSFLNAELARLKHPGLSHLEVIDTLSMARRLFPGSPASLDALCRRFEVDLSDRTKHGALIDAKLLADVYLHLRGGRQISLSLNAHESSSSLIRAEKVYLPPRPHQELCEEEINNHRGFLKTLKDPLFEAFLKQDCLVA